ncbi:hypothetical protein Pan216_21480 [Planctomycetes bacterium Pan216]|uniref:YHYH domain-containing protein n=1 Tax=Kolteria novifilia TaxID=2527975 RepID=A0A518B2S6_9BACT|nr:hypothetical protein Pan216_21480 [Planctomycetes bacterium Pan216]
MTAHVGKNLPDPPRFIAVAMMTATHASIKSRPVDRQPHPPTKEITGMSSLRYALAACSLLLVATSVLAHPGPGGHQHGQAHRDQDNEVSIVTRGNYRYITANGIPDHQHGRFPNRGNPNRIAPQRYTFRVPLQPRMNEEFRSAMGQPFGVALNGVPFDPGTAEFWNRDRRSGWNYEALSGKINLGLDASNAHVQPTGAYHYHGMPTGLIAKLGDEKKMVLVGYAADGFPIYALHGHAEPNDAESDVVRLRSSYRLKKGSRPGGRGGPGGRYDGTFVQDWEFVPGAGDLDEANGRVGVTPEYPEGTYYYVVTNEFPFIPRLYRGTPDESFARRGPGRGPGSGGRRGRRPPPFGGPGVQGRGGRPGPPGGFPPPSERDR